MGENALHPRDAYAGGNSRACGGFTGDCEQLDRQRKLGAVEGFHNHHTEGERFPNAAEADTISKLSTAIKKLETEVGLADIISVFSDLLKWVRTYDSTQAKEITPLLDAFVKSKLS